MPEKKASVDDWLSISMCPRSAAMLIGMAGSLSFAHNKPNAAAPRSSPMLDLENVPEPAHSKRDLGVNSRITKPGIHSVLAQALINACVYLSHNAKSLLPARKPFQMSHVPSSSPASHTEAYQRPLASSEANFRVTQQVDPCSLLNIGCVLLSALATLD